MAHDTIYALSSGAPPCAIAIIRISGPRALVAAESLTTQPLPAPRTAGLRTFRDPDTREVLDQGLLLVFPAEASVTGEPLVELHCHGSRAVVRRIEKLLATLPGLRAAGPGDFTRRAFANGRMDLSGVEGLGDLLAAETELQRRTALAMLDGALSRQIRDWTSRLRRLAARIEALLDFSDEGDVDQADVRQGVAAAMGEIARAVAGQLARPGAERLKDGLRVVIAGPPNAGKSTLLNALVGRDAAIVSPVAGTTRDVIEVPVSINGLPFVLTDTAGLRDDSGDAIERIGIERANDQVARADIVLWLGAAEKEIDAANVLVVHPKADLRHGAQEAATGLTVSAVTGEGMDALLRALTDLARALLPAPGDYALSVRQRAIMARVMDALIEGGAQEDEILIGENLRTALAALDELTGRVTTEAMLDELFSGFCIGK